MEEAFLHYLWKHKKFDFSKVVTCKSEEIIIIDVGTHNDLAGPDFLNSKIIIGEQLWAGSVEIHLKSSLWYTHHHEIDTNYDNVILHVVWEHDAEVFRKDNSEIPVLEIKNLVSENHLKQYVDLFKNQNAKWINCVNSFAEFQDFEINNWLERLYFDRLENKSAVIFKNLKNKENDWEAVFFTMLANSFGLNINADSFMSIANSFPFPIVGKIGKNVEKLEALFLGQAGILNVECEDAYFYTLKREYEYIKQKFNLENHNIVPVQFFRLRPDNFPTLRLAQLASLYASREKLFSKIISATEVAELRELFKIEVSEFWRNHYNFKKESRTKSKGISDNFIDLILINTVIPIKFCFAQFGGKNAENEVLKIIESINAEKNSVVSKFNSVRSHTARNALQSQGLIHMKKHFCDLNLCLKCNLGNQLLK